MPLSAHSEHTHTHTMLLLSSQAEMLRSVLGKTLGFVGYAVQYGCVAHCAFEYIGEVVVVGIALTPPFLYDVVVATVKNIKLVFVVPVFWPFHGAHHRQPRHRLL